MSRSIAFAAVCALAVTGAGAVLVPKALPRPSPRAADGTVVAIPPPPSGVAGAGSCLEHAGPLVTLSGSIGRYDARKTAVTAQRVDARAASWTGTEQWAVNAGRSSAPGLCWSGGVIHGLWPPDTPWDTWHHTGALLLYSPNATIEQVVISDYGDGVRIRMRPAVDHPAVPGHAGARRLRGERLGYSGLIRTASSRAVTSFSLSGPRAARPVCGTGAETRCRSGTR